MSLSDTTEVLSESYRSLFTAYSPSHVTKNISGLLNHRGNKSYFCV